MEDRKAWAKEMLRKLKLNGYARQIAQYHIEDDSDSSDEDETKVIQAINARPGPSNQPDGSETDSADEETREVGNCGRRLREIASDSRGGGLGSGLGGWGDRSG